VVLAGFILIHQGTVKMVMPVVRMMRVWDLVVGRVTSAGCFEGGRGAGNPWEGIGQGQRS
jgi:hypothetical protein